MTDGGKLPAQRRASAIDCAWCGGPITCRHRAWEQSRAAASGWWPVRIVERRVEVPVARQLTRHDWPRALRDLSQLIGDGRIYDRDLLNLGDALADVLAALNRRPHDRSGALKRERLARALRQAHEGSSWR